MPGSPPGSVGTGRYSPIDDGTLTRASTLPPTATGVKPPPPSTMAGADPAIEVLNLRGAAKRAAYALKKAHPTVKFTSGRRGKSDQARAMASNVVLNRKWIAQTYVSTPASRACQTWVDKNPDKTTKEEVAAGLLGVLNSQSDASLAHLSKHLSGDAFDVQPVELDAARIKRTIRGLRGLERFLEKEGGLVRWHAQF
jgi:hypothetical protein